MTKNDAQNGFLPEYIWYASYGSNLSRARFMTYIDGSRLPGTTRDLTGARDKTPPTKDISCELSHSLYFARHSRLWGGSVAFIGLGRGEPAAHARAYLITCEQFEDVVSQENAQPAGARELSPKVFEEARRIGHSRMIPSGFYSELVYVRDEDGYPVLSFTSSEDRTDFGPPSPDYLGLFHSGLQEARGFEVEDSVTYLKDLPGVKGNISELDLFEILARVAPRQRFRQ